MVTYSITNTIKGGIGYCLNKLEQDIELAAKALAVSELMAIFHPGDRKS